MTAKVIGGDILLGLMQSVAELREDMTAMQAHAQQMRTHAEQMESHARQANRHLRTFGNVLGRLARQTRSRLDDHEERIAALESGR